jgi:hypothetical protein
LKLLDKEIAEVLSNSEAEELQKIILDVNDALFASLRALPPLPQGYITPSNLTSMNATPKQIVHTKLPKL